MRLEDLHVEFLSLTEEEQLNFLENYRNKRATDIKETTIIKVKSTRSPKSTTGASKDKKVAVSKDQLEMLKKLGLLS